MDYEHKPMKMKNKAYAPNMIPNCGVTDTQKLHDQRQQKRATIERTIKETPKHATFNYGARSEDKKQHEKSMNKIGYARRMAIRLAQYKTYRPAPVNCSPFLNFREMQHLSVRERWKEYVARHKCKHGRRYTDFEAICSERNDGRSELSYLQPLCRCNVERFVKTEHNNVVTFLSCCTTCTGMTMYKLSTEADWYTARLCKNCKTTVYVQFDYITDIFNELAKPYNPDNWKNDEPFGKTRISDMIGMDMAKYDYTKKKVNVEFKDTMHVDFPKDCLKVPRFEPVGEENLSHDGTPISNLKGEDWRDRNDYKVPATLHDFIMKEINRKHVKKAVREFGFSDISAAAKCVSGSVMNAIHKLLDYVQEVSAKIRGYIVKTIGKSIMWDFWQMLSEIVFGLKDAFLKSPISNCLLMWHLLNTNSAAERIITLSAICATDAMNALIKRFVNFISSRGVEATKALIDRSKSCNMEEIYSSVADAVDNGIEKLRGKREGKTAPFKYCARKHSEEGIEMQNLSEPQSDDDEDVLYYQAAKREAGITDLCDYSTLFFKIFSVPKYLINFPSVISALKDFNACCQGWKNLHELIGNFFNYLPTWITKIFVNTDPRKRYAKDMSTPGNPVYDMKLAYLDLLYKGSSTMMETFEEKWKKADYYLVAEYPPHPQVNAMHKQYFTNSRGIMTPDIVGSRPVPFVVTLYGKPGTGKSTAWPLFLSGITGKSTVDEVRALSYTRNTSSQYFDGYNPKKHKIFVYDDFAHQVDDPCTAELISMISDANYLPTYASVDNVKVGIKGTAFDSPVVVINTNFKTFEHSKLIADHTALMRRLGIIIHVDRQICSRQTEYLVERAVYDGTAEKIGLMTVTQIQRYLLDQYRIHFQNQSLVDTKMNDLMYERQTGDVSFDFMEQYANVRDEAAKRKMKKQMEAKEEMEVRQEEAKIHLQSVPTVIQSKFMDDVGMYEGFAAQPQCPNDVAVKETGMSYGDLVRPFGYLALIAFVRSAGEQVSKEYEGLGETLLLLASAFVLVYASYKLMFSYGKATEESGENNTPKARSGKKVVFSRRTDKVRQEVGVATESDHAAMMKITQNCVQVQRDDGFFQNAIFIKGNVLLLNTHFLRNTTQFKLHSFRSSDSAIFDIDMKECRRYDFPDADLTLIQMPKHISAYPDITKYMTNKILKTSTEGYVTRTDPNARIIIVNNTTIEPGVCTLDILEDDGTYVETTDNVTYYHRHKPGDCGSVVFAHFEGGVKLMALHSSGSVNEDLMSYGCLLNKDEMLKSLDQLSKVIICRESGFPYENTYIDPDMTSVNKSDYICSSNVHITSANKTTIIPSLLHGVVPVTMKPAMLTAVGDIDPMAIGLNKYGKSTKQFPYDLVKTAVKSLGEELCSLIGPQDLRRVLTEQETINGIPGVIESMNMATSAGYPHALDPHGRGEKRKFFEGDVGDLKFNSEAKEVVDRWEECLKNGIIPSDPFIVTLKDEKRKIEKVDKGKTRLFTAGSLAGFYWNKRMFAAFNTMLQRTRERTFSSLGMNRGSTEWDSMIRWFKSISPYGFDGDQEEWDGRFKAGIAMELLDIFDLYYENSTPFDKLARTILFEHAVFAYLRITWMKSSHIIRVNGIMPSGWYMTFVVNSMVNAVLFRVAWQELISRPYNDLYYFRIYVAEKYAGDDNILAVNPKFIELFNATTISQYFAQYDQIYTSATKEGDIVSYKKIEDLSFLKTTTGYRWNKYVPLFDIEANLETVNWIRKCDNTFLATQDNCNDVLRNFFFYGEEMFEKYRNLFLSKLPKLNLISFTPLEAAFLGYGFVPDPYGTFTYTKSNNVSAELMFNKIAMKQCGFIPKILPLRFCKLKGEPLVERVPLLTDKLTPRLVTFEPGRFVRTTITMNTDANNNNKDKNDNDAVIIVEDTETDSSESIEVVSEEKENFENKQAQREAGEIKTIQPKMEPLQTNINTVNKTVSSLDESEPVVSSSVGVHLAEQQDTYVIRPGDGRTNISNARAVKHMNEPSWELVDMLSRYNLVSSFPWKIADPVNFDIAVTNIAAPAEKVAVPEDLLQLAIVSIPFQRFTYFRCKKVVIRFQITASRFHQGRLLAYFAPTMVPKNDNWSHFDMIRASTLQHCILDPSNGTVTDMEIPFIYNKGFIDLQAGDSLGYIGIKVLNGLNAVSGGSTTVEVKMFVSFVEPQFWVPRANGLSYQKLIEAEKIYNQGRSTVINKSNVPLEVNDIEYEIIKIPKKTALRQSGKPRVFGDIGDAIDDVLDIIPTVTSVIGSLDRPAVQDGPKVIANKDMQYMSTTRGVEHLDKLTIEPTCLFATDDQFGLDVDETDIRYLTTKKCFYETFDWGVGDSVGTIVGAYTVSPTHLMTSNPQGGASPTPLGFVSQFFTYWRGGIVFEFHIVGTAFHEGRLDFSFHPGLQAVPADYVASQSQYTVSRTIRNVDNIITVVCPFLSDNGPWKRVWRNEKLNIAVDNESKKFGDFCTGVLAVRVSVPLKAPSSVVQAVKINTFIRAADDFELNTMSAYGPNFVPDLPVTVKKIAIREIGEVNQSQSAEVDVLPLAISRARTSDMKIPHFGERYANLTDMCKRYQPMKADKFEGGASKDIYFEIPTSLPYNNGLLPIMCQMYRLFRGPMKYKFSANVMAIAADKVPIPLQNIAFEGGITFIPFSPYNPAALQTARRYLVPSTVGEKFYGNPSVARFSHNQIAEFEVPFNSIYHSLLLPQYEETTTHHDIDKYHVNSLIATIQSHELMFTEGIGYAKVGIQYALWSALGDEARFGVFLGIPVVYPIFTHAQSSAGVYPGVSSFL